MDFPNGPLPDDRIISFIRQHHVLNLATSSGNIPWCASCFYAYHPEKNWLIFTSDINTRHILEALNQPEVAGTIVLETKIIGKIRGVQFSGILSQPAASEKKICRKTYLTRFPFAALMNTTLWKLEPHLIKFTDNRLGFGKKIVWKKPD